MSKNKNYRKFAVTTMAAAAAVASVAPVVASADETFTDVNDKTVPEADMQEAIYALVEIGAISGFKDGTFKPGQSITRGQVAEIMTKALELPIPENADEVNEKYSDTEDFYDKAPYIAAVSEAGNGNYYSANNAEEIQETIEYDWLPSMGELAWAHMKAPGPWEILAEYDRYRAEHKKIRQLIEKENDRFDAAMDILIEEDLLTPEIYQEVDELISGRYNNKMDIYRDLETKKIEEIDAIADEIDERVDKWINEMEELVYD